MKFSKGWTMLQSSEISLAMSRSSCISVKKKQKRASLLCELFYLTCVVDSILLLLLLHFTRTVVASLKIRKRLILKKLLLLSALFQHFRFRVRFRFQPLSSKCFRFHKNLTASASSFRFRFHIPVFKPKSV